MRLPIDPATVKGFLSVEEGAALFALARECARIGPIVEIGSYCGKSAVYLGAAAKEVGATVFTVDHHRGSEEHQPGWAYFDPSLWDDAAQAPDSSAALRETLRRADLEDTVITVIGRSEIVGRIWAAPLGLLFLDGGHSRAQAFADYEAWASHLAPGGVMAIHDVFADPADGGRPPFEVFEAAKASGEFDDLGMAGSLARLRRRA